MAARVMKYGGSSPIAVPEPQRMTEGHSSTSVMRKVAERAFRSKHDESEATQATQIFDSLSKKWGLTTEVKNDMWRELEERYPELDRRKALKRMGRLLRQCWQRRKAILQELQKWKPWSEEKVDIGAVKLTERVDLRAAKYVLSLKEDEFKTLYLERAKKKAEAEVRQPLYEPARDLHEPDGVSLRLCTNRLVQ